MAAASSQVQSTRVTPESTLGNRGTPLMWSPSFWFYPFMPWLIATQLPAMFFAALVTPPEAATARRAAASAEIIPFPVRRAAAG